MIDEFWAEFVAATGIDGDYEAWAFADGMNELATELALLVRDGPKRATVGLLSQFGNGPEQEPLPTVGGLSLILDGDGHPVCVIRTTDVEMRSFGDVDEEFAWTEGEGDRTLSWWREAHTRYYARLGIAVDDDTPMVLERFELLYPV